jgi:hypothetical protein
VPEVVGEPEELPEEVSVVADDPELIEDEPVPDEPDRIPAELHAPRTKTQARGRIHFFMRSSLKVINGKTAHTRHRKGAG